MSSYVDGKSLLLSDQATFTAHGVSSDLNKRFRAVLETWPVGIYPMSVFIGLDRFPDFHRRFEPTAERCPSVEHVRLQWENQ